MNIVLVGSRTCHSEVQVASNAEGRVSDWRSNRLCSHNRSKCASEAVNNALHVPANKPDGFYDCIQ
jgi:hypothetical protein